MIGIIDYGMGNLKSVENACKKLNIPCMISADPDALNQCEKLILPGVGAFGDCMANIREKGLYEKIIEMAETKPLLGICLGMQMLFEESEEKGLTKGFGFLKGRIIKMETDLPVPEIGWNELEWNQSTPLQKELSDHPHAYYVHSYYANAYEDEDLIAYSMYGDIKVPGIVKHGHIMGCQFHPEKNADDGLRILQYFQEEV